ncbi:glycosyltransferase [Microbulbifer hydrolyticus]|uniref:Glycosyltransferase n=1 Tax=Microbulbifer hydrolyticus TaxID=48074 RepID=A0A6P1TC86_9GAMM|nr:glycosyltransferase [Microbulbifer hydrolyticus]MBB5210057.1 glycosyltransferase involved in cell wall biosynthesis [Microbulbifer hydrolyticus]QHQ39421.1 glycosyltransferase [Microbulbifer hydrolyticus]
MRIVQLVPSLEAGELAQETLEFAQELARQGQDSVVISSGGTLVSRLTLHNCRHFELPLNQTKWVNARLHRKLRRLLDTLQADILLCRGPLCAWHATRVLRKMEPRQRPRLVTSIHQWPSVGLFRGRRINPALAQGELVLSASNALAEQLSRRYAGKFVAARASVESSGNEPTEKLRTLYRGVNTRELDKNAPVSGHWHHRLLNDFPQLEERNWLLLPGPVGAGRGQERFLDVLAALKQERSDIFGLVVGNVVPGHEKFARALEQRAESMGLAEYVLFLGERRDMRELYASARITFDLADDRSKLPPSSGRIVAESLAMGCPAIATGGTGVELLKQCFPQGVVEMREGASGAGAGSAESIAAVASGILAQPRPVEFSGFSLSETTLQAVDWFRELQEVSCV